jgi:hypothetical protein
VSLPYVRLDRDTLVKLPGEAYAVFVGEWSPEEPTGWERFRVMLLGEEAGDMTEATWSDLRLILAALTDQEEE